MIKRPRSAGERAPRRMRRRHRTAVIRGQRESWEAGGLRLDERVARAAADGGRRPGLAVLRLRPAGHPDPVPERRRPGPMYGKEGPAARAGADSRSCGRTTATSALHHDLTNCLRIADPTELTVGGGGLLRCKIKRKPRTEKAQMDRAQAAVERADAQRGALPGRGRGARLIQLTEPYVTNLAQLGELIQMAKEARLSRGRPCRRAARYWLHPCPRACGDGAPTMPSRGVCARRDPPAGDRAGGHRDGDASHQGRRR